MIRSPPPKSDLAQFPPEGLLARIVFFSVAGARTKIPPPPSVARLPEKVLLVTDRCAPLLLKTPPWPAEPALLLAKVLLVTFRVPWFMAPPAPLFSVGLPSATVSLFKVRSPVGSTRNTPV